MASVETDDPLRGRRETRLRARVIGDHHGLIGRGLRESDGWRGEAGNGSLLPSATEIVCLLGLEDQLVGVSADSDWPVEVVKRQPVLNTVSIDTSQLTSKEIDTAAGDGHRGASLYHVDSELLRHLR